MQTPPPLGNILVSGSASGLGAAVMAGVTSRGGTPWGLDRDATGGAWQSETVDVADTDAVEQAVARLRDRAGGFDAVVTCAGIDACGPFDEVPAHQWAQVIAVNLIGTANVVRAVLPDLLERRGHVVTIASTLALRAFPGATAYCASKFGVLGFSRALATELQGRIGTTTIVTGGMATAFFDGRDPEYQPGPDADLNPPDAVADAILFALADRGGCRIRELVVTPDTEPSWP